MIHCPGCGQGLRFDIQSQQMVCDYCDGTYDPAITADINKDAEGHQEFETYVFTCPSCGGELATTDQNDAVGFCPYCGGASMLYDRINASWKPKHIIPFKITKEQCREQYLKKVKRNIFTSRKYRDPKLIESFRGIYMPYWSYHAKHTGRFMLKADKTEFSTIDTYLLSGDIDMELEGYGHDASRAFEDRISEDLSPFDVSEQKPFAPGYLSGFYADIGDVDEGKYKSRIVKEIGRDTAAQLAKDKRITKPGNKSGKYRVIPNTEKIPTEITEAEESLYPVWFMSYRSKNKLTYAAVNGQTGKVSADLPVSPWRILLAVLLVGAILAAGLIFMPSMKANWTLALTALLLIVGMIVLSYTFRCTVNEQTGLIDTPEAKKFKKHDIWRKVIVALSIIAAFIVAMMDLAYNWITYTCCLVLAAELFWVMLCHIRFQAEIAKRRPPQFNKKGAAYDEN